MWHYLVAKWEILPERAYKRKGRKVIEYWRESWLVGMLAHYHNHLPQPRLREIFHEIKMALLYDMKRGEFLTDTILRCRPSVNEKSLDEVLKFQGLDQIFVEFLTRLRNEISEQRRVKGLPAISHSINNY